MKIAGTGQAGTMVLAERIGALILLIRGHRVLLDRDLAALYGVATGALNQAVKRHLDRFPGDFMFRLSPEETRLWREHLSRAAPNLRKALRLPPYAFTEQGVAMLSSVLNSERAVKVNIAIMRSFVRLRGALASHKELAGRLKTLERRLGRHKKDCGSEIAAIWEALSRLMEPPKTPGRKIGFIPG